MSDVEEDPRNLRSSKSSMKSIFESDRRATRSGSQSLKYEGKKKEAPPVAPQGGTQNVAACNATAVAYRGEDLVGPCVCVVMVNPQSAMANLLLVDKERRPLFNCRVDRDMQLLQNPSELQYATIFDATIRQHWTLMFKTAEEATRFVVSVHTLLYHILSADAPQPMAMDVTEGATPVPKNGDKAVIAMSVWLSQRVGQSALYVCGKLVEEIARTAPREVKVGDGSLMLGVEETLRLSGPGSKKILFLGPRKTRMSGIGNPEIGSNDSVVVLLEVFSVEPTDAVPPLGGDESEEEDLFGKPRAKGKKAATKSSSAAARTVTPDPAQVQPVSPATTTAAAPASTASTATDPNSVLLQTLLLNTLQMQQRPAPAPSPPAAHSEERGGVSVDVERAIDRLSRQMSALYEKIDRMDFESKLDANNAKLERIVKKAVGKMPVNDVDIEDMSKDRDQLLAKIESQRQRLEEMTDHYHRALEQLGQHKENTAALKNDIVIERETSQQRIRELTESRRLMLVEMEVKHRSELDSEKEKAFNEGKEKGYTEGYAVGKLDATHSSGSTSAEEMRQLLQRKDEELVQQESRIAELMTKQYEERREFEAQANALRDLVDRLEEREKRGQRSKMDSAGSIGKRLRTIMNDTYSSIETQFYATEKKKIPVEDALQMVLVSIKGESRRGLEALRRDAELSQEAMLSTTAPDAEAAPREADVAPKEEVPAPSIPLPPPQTEKKEFENGNQYSSPTEGDEVRTRPPPPAFVPPPPPPGVSNAAAPPEVSDADLEAYKRFISSEEFQRLETSDEPPRERNDTMTYSTGEADETTEQPDDQPSEITSTRRHKKKPPPPQYGEEDW